MKTLISIFLFTISIFTDTSILAQQNHLDVEGHTKFRGNIDINHMDDTTSVIIGRNAGVNTPFSYQHGNTFMGSNVGYNNISGTENSFFGYKAGFKNQDGDGNTFFGVSAGFNNNGHNNCFFGREAGYNTEAGGNCFFGRKAGHTNISGSGNSFFGMDAGRFNRVGSRNTFIGFDSNPLNDDSLVNAIAIGYRAEVACHNCAVIGGTGENAVQVGINTTTPTERLDVNGNIRVRSVGFGIGKKDLWLTEDGELTVSTSDRRLKDNIVEIKHPLEKTLALRGVSFTWKNDMAKEKRIGLIAQEVEEVVPEVVFTNEVDGYMGVNYTEIVALLIEGIKEQQSIIEGLQTEIKALEEKQSEIDQLKDEIALLKQMFLVKSITPNVED